MERTLTLRNELRAGVLAGVAGGVLFHLFLLGAQIAGGAPAGPTVAATYRFIASAVLGGAAATAPAAVALGIVVHLCIAIGWALGYVYLVRGQPQLLRRPWISGVMFGLVVYLFMDLVLMAGGLYRPPKPAELALSLIAHAVFFGIPVAVIASQLLRRA